MISTFDKISGSLWQDQHANNEDDGPCELNCHRDTVASSVVAVLGCIENDCCNEETDRDGPLVTATTDSSQLVEVK